MFDFLFQLFLLAVLLHTFYCIMRILQRMGYSGWTVLLVPFWPVTVAILAYRRWPIEDRAQPKVKL